MWIALILWMFLPGTTSFTACRSNFCPPERDNVALTIDSRELPLNLVGHDVLAGCTCRELPNVYTMCYNYNDKATPCIKFPRKIQLLTTSLLLKSTYIKKIARGDFVNLAHLEFLAIDGNQQLRHIDPFVFENMTNLTMLRFIFNPALSNLEPNTFQGLVNLQSLDLVKNGFHSIEMLAQTLKPTILPKLYRLNLNENVFKNISENDFSPMKGSSLRELNLISCGIENIHPGSLRFFENLSALRLGENRFEPTTLIDLLNETLNKQIDLQLLDLYASGFRVSPPMELLEVIAASNISSLTLTRNQFDVLDKQTFPVLMPNLIGLDLTDVSAQSIDDHAFINFPNLRTLTLSRNKLSFFAASRYLPNLTYLDLSRNSDSYGSEFFLTRSEFHRMSLEYLDLHFTRLILLTKTDFGYLPQLRILDLKNCGIIKIENGTFGGLPNLDFLNLENNRFFNMWTRYHFDIFGGLENLRVLFMGGNSINTLRTPVGHLLKYLKNIETLGLERNSLQTISAEDFAPLTQLKALDISHNFLLAWDDRVFPTNNLEEFTGSVNKIAYLSDAMIQDFRNLSYIELDYNSFSCDCRFKSKFSSNKADLTKFLNIIKDQKILCLKPSNVTLSDFYQSVRDSLLDCDIKKLNTIVLIIPFVILFVILIISAVFGYIYRWHIKYWAFLVRLHLTRKGKIRNEPQTGYTNYQFDAFVSYCNQDRNFVVRLVRMLENCEPYLKLCVYERDFQVGSVLTESVLEHIAKSRKTVLIVSNSYAKSYWCTWESQIVEHHRLFFEDANLKNIDQSIVLIKLGSINESQLTPTLKYLLKTRIYLQWELEDDKQKIFWRKLRQFLTPRESEILQNTYL